MDQYIIVFTPSYQTKKKPEYYISRNVLITKTMPINGSVDNSIYTMVSNKNKPEYYIRRNVFI